MRSKLPTSNFFVMKLFTLFWFIAIDSLTAEAGLLAESPHQAHPLISQTIVGFRYQTCTAERCLELTSPKAWIANTGLGFSTASPTLVRLWDSSTHRVILAEKGDSAVYYGALGDLVVNKTKTTFTVIDIQHLSATTETLRPHQAKHKPRSSKR